MLTVRAACRGSRRNHNATFHMLTGGTAPNSWSISHPLPRNLRSFSILTHGPNMMICAIQQDDIPDESCQSNWFIGAPGSTACTVRLWMKGPPVLRRIHL